MTDDLPKVPWTTRLGASAESEIKARLDRFSIATKYDVDPGLDFYCELVERNDSPSMPFYVQAKGTDHFSSSWAARVRKQTVSYWLQQQHPVFLVVYDNIADRCRWMSVETQRYAFYERMAKYTGDSIGLNVDDWPELARDADSIDSFILALKDADLSLRAFWGNPQFRGESYVKSVPLRPRSEIELKRIIHSVRASLYSLVQHYAGTDPDRAMLLCDFLAQIDVSHFTHHVWRGNLARIAGDITTARESYSTALAICRRDEEWPKASMDEIIKEVESLLAELDDLEKNKKKNDD